VVELNEPPAAAVGVVVRDEQPVQVSGKKCPVFITNLGSKWYFGH